MTKSKKFFGTDGIRGASNQEPMTIETLVKVGKAAAYSFRKDSTRPHYVIIGKDTRLSGYMFETALVSGMCSMGVNVILVGPLPTPGIAYLTTAMRADAGVVISASHNPYQDNGVKFFGGDGFKLADSMELEMEKWILDDSLLREIKITPDQIGRAKRLEDAKGRYVTFLKENFSRDHSLAGLRIVLDCAHGATYKVAPAVFEELGASLRLLGVNPNGKNINRECGSLFPKRLSQKVIDTQSDLGVAFDGDGDRVMMCDEKGRIFDGDDILGILAQAMQVRGELGSVVVGTVMSNFGLEKTLNGKGIEFFRAPVGDRYVVEKMREKKASLGGEPSGHLVDLSRSTTGDGILSSLLLLAELCRANQPLSYFASWVERFPQEVRNIQVREQKGFDQMPKVFSSIREAENKLKGKGRILVRYSGTEPKARVMVEGENEMEVQQLADEIAFAIRLEIGAPS